MWTHRPTSTWSMKEQIFQNISLFPSWQEKNSLYSAPGPGLEEDSSEEWRYASPLGHSVLGGVCIRPGHALWGLF